MVKTVSQGMEPQFVFDKRVAVEIDDSPNKPLYRSFLYGMYHKDTMILLSTSANWITQSGDNDLSSVLAINQSPSVMILKKGKFVKDNKIEKEFFNEIESQFPNGIVKNKEGIRNPLKLLENGILYENERKTRISSFSKEKPVKNLAYYKRRLGGEKPIYSRKELFATLLSDNHEIKDIYDASQKQVGQKNVFITQDKINQNRLTTSHKSGTIKSNSKKNSDKTNQVPNAFDKLTGKQKNVVIQLQTILRKAKVKNSKGYPVSFNSQAKDPQKEFDRFLAEAASWDVRVEDIPRLTKRKTPKKTVTVLIAGENVSINVPANLVKKSNEKSADSVSDGR